MEERIEKYILGQMTEDEKSVFEKELSSDADLRNEYELQREIILAIQRVNLKKHLKNVELQMQIKRRNMLKRIYSCSVAAVLIIAITIGLDVKYSNDLREISDLYYSGLSVPVTRSNNQIDDVLVKVHQSIGSDNLEDAQRKLVSLNSMIDKLLREPVVSEEDMYRNEILILQKQDIDWYQALIYMKKGKIYKSRKALKDIASSSSRYAEDAKQILHNEIFM